VDAYVRAVMQTALDRLGRERRLLILADRNNFRHPRSSLGRWIVATLDLCTRKR
jgi:hypothetical protein